MMGKRQGKRKHMDIQSAEDQTRKRNSKRKGSRADQTSDIEGGNEKNEPATAMDETQPPILDVDSELTSSQRGKTENICNLHSMTESSDVAAEKSIISGSTEVDQHGMSYEIRLQKDAPGISLEDSNSMSILDSKPDQNVIVDLVCKPESVSEEKCKLNMVGDSSYNDPIADFTIAKDGKINSDIRDNFKKTHNNSGEQRPYAGLNKINSQNMNNPGVLVRHFSFDDDKSIFCSQTLKKKFQPPLKRGEIQNKLNVNEIKTNDSCLLLHYSNASSLTSHMKNADEKLVKCDETDEKVCGKEETFSEQNNLAVSGTSLLSSKVNEKVAVNILQTSSVDESTGNEIEFGNTAVTGAGKKKLFDEKEPSSAVEMTLKVQGEKTVLLEENQLECFSHISMNNENDICHKSKSDLCTENQLNLCSDIAMEEESSVIFPQHKKIILPNTLSQSPTKTVVFSQESRQDDSILQENDHFNGCTQKFDTSFVDKNASQSNPDFFADRREQNQSKEDGDPDGACLYFAKPFADLKDIPTDNKPCESKIETKKEVKRFTEMETSEPLKSEPIEISQKSNLNKEGAKMVYNKVFEITNCDSECKEVKLFKNPNPDVPKSNKEELGFLQKLPDHGTSDKDDKSLNLLISNNTCLAENLFSDNLSFGTYALEKKSNDAKEEKLLFDIFKTPEKNTANCSTVESFGKDSNNGNDAVSIIPVKPCEQPELEKDTNYQLLQLSKSSMNMSNENSSKCIPKTNLDDKAKEISNGATCLLTFSPEDGQNIQGQECTSSSSRQLMASPWDGDGASDAMMMMLTDSQLCGDSSREQDLEKVVAERRAEAVKHMAMRRDEGRTLTQLVLNELMSVNKQLFKLKREMDSFKRSLSLSGGPRHSTSLQLRPQNKQQQIPIKFKQLNTL